MDLDEDFFIYEYVGSLVQLDCILGDSLALLGRFMLSWVPF